LARRSRAISTCRHRFTVRIFSSLHRLIHLGY
jgi:hypothetical protein